MAFVLQACSGVEQPFSKSNKPVGRTAPPISIAQMNGLPQDKKQLLSGYLQEAAAKRDIAIVAQDFPDSWKLVGKFGRQTAADGSARLAYDWTLSDAKARMLHQINGGEPAGSGGGGFWASVTPEMLRRVAAFTTENLSSRLAQMGYATQTSGVTPPTDTYARAGPHAERELDYETLYGPGLASVAGAPAQRQTVAEAVAAANDPDLAQPAPEPAPAPDPEPAPKTEQVAAAGKPQSKPNAQAIRGVAVTRVKGAPGTGNRELTSAMRKVLKQAGWPVYTSPRDDALTISGSVDLGPPRGALQKVALAWTVTSPDGKVLGTIKQANDIATGSLDAKWGKTADYAAQAGAQGIFDLVKQLR